MMKQDEQLNAAEYVIGTLPNRTRKSFEASLETDDAVKAEVKFWERTFGALNASVAPEVPPKDMWDRIESELPEQVAQWDNVRVAANDNLLDKLERSKRRWRMGAIAASFLALGLGVFIANERVGLVPIGAEPQLAEELNGNEFIAVVNANGDQPSLVVNVNAKTGEVTVRSVGVERPDGKSLELWYVPEGQDAVSVGLVGESGIDLKNIAAKGGDLLAISLEPKGGSPTGTATGPVIYTGKLIENVAAK